MCVTFPISASKSELCRDVEFLSVVEQMTCEPKNEDEALLSRIIKAYQNVSSHTEKRGKSMWQDFFTQRHASMHQIFKAGQVEEAKTILRDPAANELFYGIDNLTISIQPLIAQNPYPHALICLDSLIRFAEIIGAVGYHRPSKPWTAEEVIGKIEKTLNLTLNFPNPYPNEWGVWTPRGIVSYRVPQALYQAWRIKELLKDVGHPPKVLEIGAGVGRTAYFANLFGIEDYTIVDLPFTALSSSYFLGTTLGANKILLSGEHTVHPEKYVKIITPNEYLESDVKYDLILNADSLTEMDPGAAKAYWNKIESNRGLFLSINHDRNPFTVQSLIEKSEHVEQYDQKPYWMRKIYFEELVRFRS